MEEDEEDEIFEDELNEEELMDGKVGGVLFIGFKIVMFEFLCGCFILLKLLIGIGYGWKW